MLKIALTKGRIEQKAVEMLANCGYDTSELSDKGRKLLFHCPHEKAETLEIVLAKANDVITYVEHGTCDIGIVGRDTIMEMGGTFYELLDLNFGICRFALAGPKGKNIHEGYAHRVIATKYPNVTKRYFESMDTECEIVKIDGSVELAPLLGLADAIVDIVETGATLRENGLEVYEDVAPVSARCIVNNASMKMRNDAVEDFVERLSRQIPPSKS
ncbi:MAG: ATP phosphoribosyltransferase [Clostridia bacterium]|nr:ATP phosphoribosyltransferase [Clostridia bacterium]